MNFKKIIWIFFLAFIVLDIFLIYSYTQQNDYVDATTNTVNGNEASSILKSIHNDQITTGKISQAKGVGYYIASADDDYLRDKADQLNFVSWAYNNHRLTVTFATMVKLGTNPQKTMKALLNKENQVINGKDYRYAASLSSKNTLVYTQLVHGKPVYSSAGQIRFTVKNGYVTGYTQGYLSKVQTLREKKETISQQRALVWLYQYNKLPSNSTIEWSDLGYTKLLAVNNSTIYIPTWNFYIKNNASGNYYYRRINAFTGTVMEED